jgi:hypothetical protein
MKIMNVSELRNLLLTLLLALPLAVFAQENGEGKNGDGEKKEDEKPKTIAELTEDAERYDGLFTLFRDKKSGEVSMLIKADQLDQEFIYWVQIANGVVDAGYFRGAYGPSYVFTLHRHFNKIEVVHRNTSFYFDPDNAISRAADANISDAVLAMEKILAEDEESGDILIKADKLFATEAFSQITPSPDPDADPKKDFSLGKLDGDKSRVLNLRSYPLNTDVEVEYVFSNPTPKVGGSEAVTSARNISIRVMHSLIAMPDNGYQPRFADPRVGSFDVQVTDLTSTEATPYRDMIRRWDLVKKDPDAELSEPVEPITCGADIMLEYSFMNRVSRARNLIQGETLEGSDFQLNPSFATTYCTLGHGLQLNSSFAQLAADVAGMSDAMDEQLTRDTMHYLILHELGHTLGMNHNMKATNLLTPDQAFDKEAVEKYGLAGSVMDYPAINFAPTEEQQTLFYAITPGPYDDWFIEYVYSPGLDDPAAEAARLDAIASRSTQPELAFGNDADDMRSPGRAMDPRVNIYDMSSDAVTYAQRQMALMQDTLDRMADFRPDEGKSYEEVREGVGVMMNLWGRSAAVASRYVGGVYVDRAMVGQQGGGDPFRPVEEAKQKQAMQVLNDHVFAPDAFELSDDLLRRTAPERRGFSHFAGTEDPKVHDAVLTIQKSVLDHLLHPVVLKRITDTALYGNSYSLAEMMGDLTDSMFEADARENVNSFRQNLQMEYVGRLAGMVTGEGRKAYHTPAQSLALYQLTRVQDLLERKRGGNTATKAHTQNLLLTIERALAVES